MSKTKADIIARAHRTLGILAADEAPSADDQALGRDTLDGIYEEMQNAQGMQFGFSLNAIPEAAFMPLSDLLASELAPHYGVAAPSRARAITRLRAYVIQDDR